MNGSFDCSKPGMESFVNMITMDQYEQHDLTTLLDLSRNEIDGLNHIVNAEVSHGHQNQPSFPEDRNMDFVNGPSESGYYQRSSVLGPETSTVPRRIARVQPQIGQNTQTRCRDSRQGGTAKASKMFRRSSILRPILPKGMQKLTDIAGLQANTLPEAQALNNQPILILTPQQTTPRVTGLDSSSLNSPNIDVVVPSTLKNFNVLNVSSQFSEKLLSGQENNAVVAPDQVKAPEEQWYAIPVYAHPNQTDASSVNYGKADHNVTQKCQMTYPQQHGDRSNGQNKGGRQLPLLVDEQISGHEGLYNMATLQDGMKTLANSQEMQAMDQGSLLNELLEYNTEMEGQMHHKAKGTDAASGENTTPSHLQQWEVQTMLQTKTQEVASLNNPMTLSNMNFQRSGRAGDEGYVQHTDPSETVSSGTHQHPPLNGPSYPRVNTTQQSDTGAGVMFAAGQQYVQSPMDTPVPRNMKHLSLTHHRSNDPKDLNGNMTYQKHISRSDVEKHVAMKKKRLKFFKSLDREEKTALLREKYAELLKRRREQLQRFDPNYKISLRKMSNASRELQTLTKMTNKNCPPRLAKMVKGTGQFGKRSDQNDGKSRTMTSSKGDVGHEDNEDIIIDLTRDSSSPAHEENGQGHKEMPSRKHDSRLPSYEEAISMIRGNADTDKLTQEVMSSVAKRLLSSSQEFFEKYHSPFKTSGEVLPTETSSTKENVVENTTSTTLDSSSGTPLYQCTSKEPTEHSQANVKSYLSNQKRQSACDQNLKLPLSATPSTEVLFRSATELRRPAVASSTSLDLHSKNFPASRESDTPIKKAVDNNEAQDSPKPVMKSDSVFKEPTGSPSRLSGPSTRQADEPNDSTAKEKDSTKAVLDAVYMGNEKHTLKNAVVRIEDIRKRSPGRTEDITVDNKEECLVTKAKPRRKRRINSYEWNASKRQRKASAGVRRPRSSSTSGRHTFQDFVPTILPTRTRRTTSGQNSSSHTLAMELLQHDLDSAIDYDKEEENDDDDDDLDENYSPRSKYVKRHHMGRKKSTSSVLSDSEVERISEGNQTKTDSVESYQPLRVEIGKNSQNHIKLKFVNLRSISHESSHEGDATQPLPHRKNRRSGKTKRQNKDRTTTSGTSQELKDHPRSPCETEKEQETDKAESGNLQAVTNIEMNSADSRNFCDALPNPPPGDSSNVCDVLHNPPPADSTKICDALPNPPPSDSSNVCDVLHNPPPSNSTNVCEALPNPRPGDSTNVCEVLPNPQPGDSLPNPQPGDSSNVCEVLPNPPPADSTNVCEVLPNPQPGDSLTNPPPGDSSNVCEVLPNPPSADSTNACDALPNPPPGMKKLAVNKKFGETLLHRAAKLGNMEILRYCIDNHIVDVNARDKAGYTSLHDSCVPGHLDVAEFLIDHGADVNSEAYHGSRPINDAVQNDHVDLVRLLLNHGADPFLPSATGRTCIQQALDQSSEMRSLIFGYLENMKVEKCNLEDELEDFILFMEQPGT